MIAVSSRPFGVAAGGEAAACYDLKNERGMVVSVLDYGCTIQRILVPDRTGALVDVALGYDDLAGYESGNCYFGAFVGRCANRIGGARFSLDGVTYSLSANDGEHHLHGVFPHRVFSAALDGNAIVFTRRSPAFEEGYPGNLDVTVRVSLTEDNALQLQYEAVTDAPTVVNFTNHTYFNLNGAGTILNHTLCLRADSFAETDAALIPTGRILPVDGTAMDFRESHTVGERIAQAGGYDHHYVLQPGPQPFAELIGDRTGIRMTVRTTQPGVQLYSGNFVQDDTAPFGKGGKRYAQHAGLCLETQHVPDSPNHPEFPSIVLRPGERYHEKTIYRFS